MNTSLFKPLAIALLVLSLALAIVAAVKADVVSSYNVNGETVVEGATFEELRAIAGDPLCETRTCGLRNLRLAWFSLENPPGSPIYRLQDNHFFN